MKALKVGRSRNKFVFWEKLRLEKETNLFFYLDSPILLKVSSISGQSGLKKIIRLFFGRSYDSTISFRDLLTFRKLIQVIPSAFKKQTNGREI